MILQAGDEAMYRGYLLPPKLMRKYERLASERDLFAQELTTAKIELSEKDSGVDNVMIPVLTFGLGVIAGMFLTARH